MVRSKGLLLVIKANDPLAIILIFSLKIKNIYFNRKNKLKGKIFKDKDKLFFDSLQNNLIL